MRTFLMCPTEPMNVLTPSWLWNSSNLVLCSGMLGAMLFAPLPAIFLARNVSVSPPSAVALGLGSFLLFLDLPLLRLVTSPVPAGGDTPFLDGLDSLAGLLVLVVADGMAVGVGVAEPGWLALERMTWMLTTCRKSRGVALPQEDDEEITEAVSSAERADVDGSDERPETEGLVVGIAGPDKTSWIPGECEWRSAKIARSSSASHSRGSAHYKLHVCARRMRSTCCRRARLVARMRR